MSKIGIPREAVEAGARAIVKAAYAGSDAEWDRLQPTQQHTVRERALEVLNAAGALLVAAYLEGPFADELKNRADARAQIGDDDQDEDTCEEEGYDCHTAAAVATWLRARTMAKACAIGLRGES